MLGISVKGSYSRKLFGTHFNFISSEWPPVWERAVHSVYRECCQFMYLVISLLVLRAGCGIWLYKFLIIVHLFTLNRLPIWNSPYCSMFPLAFVAGSLQGHWWGFISRNYVVWPIFFRMNVFIALKGTHIWFLFAFTAAGVVQCGGRKTSPRTSTIVQFIFYFWSFETSVNILRNQK